MTSGCYTVNVLDAKHTTFSCFMFPDALWMQFMQLEMLQTFVVKFETFMSNHLHQSLHHKTADANICSSCNCLQLFAVIICIDLQLFALIVACDQG